MAAMLTLISLTLMIAIIVIKRLRPPIRKTSANEIKDTHGNNPNHFSSFGDGTNQLTSIFPSKNYDIATSQQNDEQYEHVLDNKSNHNPLEKLSSNTNNSLNGDMESRPLLRDLNSTPVFCSSDEQNRILNNHNN